VVARGRNLHRALQRCLPATRDQGRGRVEDDVPEGLLRLYPLDVF
jgi:hypothetical protein